jgi:hypothetical protein
MDVFEDPIVTRQAVGNVLSFGGPTTDAPLRTLRRHAALSDGISVPLRSASGRLLGRLRLYSALNKDAARLFRRHDPVAAARLARRARQIERSTSARHVVAAIEGSASQLPLDADAAQRTDPAAQRFRHYVDVRTATSWEALDQAELWRAWVAEPETWLANDGGGAVQEAIYDLASRIAEVRAAEPALVRLAEARAVTTRLGVVERLDPIAAELASPDGSRFIVPRRDLEREGLARVGQAVTMLREEIPGGPVIDFYAPAARLDVERPSHDVDPFGLPMPVRLNVADSAWFERVIASEPTVVPTAPIARSEL